jgi:hypothetical protein
LEISDLFVVLTFSADEDYDVLFSARLTSKTVWINSTGWKCNIIWNRQKAASRQNNVLVLKIASFLYIQALFNLKLINSLKSFNFGQNLTNKSLYFSAS